MIFVLGSTANKGYEVFKRDYAYSSLKAYYYTPRDVATVKFRRGVAFNMEVRATTLNENIKFYVPAVKGTECYDKFPCATFFLNYNYKLRGESLQDGFVTSH